MLKSMYFLFTSKLSDDLGVDEEIYHFLLFLPIIVKNAIGILSLYGTLAISAILIGWRIVFKTRFLKDFVGKQGFNWSYKRRFL